MARPEELSFLPDWADVLLELVNITIGSKKQALPTMKRLPQEAEGDICSSVYSPFLILQQPVFIMEN